MSAYNVPLDVLILHFLLYLHCHTETHMHTHAAACTSTLSHSHFFLGSKPRSVVFSVKQEQNIRLSAPWLLFYMMLICSQRLCKGLAKLIFPPALTKQCYNQCILAAVTYKSGRTLEISCQCCSRKEVQSEREGELKEPRKINREKLF